MSKLLKLTYQEAKDWIFDNLPDYVPPKPIGLGQFDKFIFPVIANMMPQTSLVEIMAVQPMDGPDPNVFYRI